MIRSRTLERKDLNRSVCLTILAALIIGYLTHAYGFIFILSVFAYCLMTIPGYVYLRRMALPRITALTLGVTSGYAGFGLLAMVGIPLVGWSVTLFLAWLPATLVTFYLRLYKPLAAEPSGRWPGGQINAFFSVEREFAGCLAIGGIVMGALLYGFSTAGEHTPDGYAFTGIFSHDYLIRAVYSVAVAHGIPPRNLYFNGELIHNYYVMGYLFPALINLWSDFGFDPRKIVTVYSLGAAFHYLIIFWMLLLFVKNWLIRKQLIAPHIPFIFICGLFAFLSYSAHWIFVIFKKMVEVGHLIQLTDAANLMSYVSQSWIRDFFYEPQAVIALMLTMTVLLLLGGMRGGVRRGIMISIILCAIAMTDTALFLVTAPSCLVVMLFADSSLRLSKRILEIGATGAVGLITLAALIGVGIIQFNVPGNSLVLVNDPFNYLAFPGLVILEFGVLPVLGGVAVYQNRKYLKEPIVLYLLCLLVIGGLLAVSVTDSLEGNVMLRKGLKVMRLPITIFAALAISQLASSRRNQLLGLTVLISVPTLATDIAAVSVHHGLAKTTFISEAEMAAARWLKTNTNENAVVQGLVNHQGAFTYSFTVDFGERQAALGDWKIAYVNYPNKTAISERATLIGEMLSTSSNTRRKDIMDGLGIDYIYLGPQEKHAHPSLSDQLASEPDLFTKAYSYKNEVAIYRNVR